MEAQHNMPPLKALHNSKSDATLAQSTRHPDAESDSASNYTLRKINPQGGNPVPRSKYSSSQSSIKPIEMLEGIERTHNRDFVPEK